jgi:hypothetical protein
VLATGVPGCTEVQNLCAVANPTALPTDPHITTQAVLTQHADGTWELTGWDCSLRTARAHLTPLLVRQQIERLVPHPAIGVAPPGGTTLVNIQTLLWLETRASRSLGTVTLMGHRVALQVAVSRVDWRFGDGTADTTNGPGRPYDSSDHCAAIACPGFYGHFYRKPGDRAVTAAVTWQGRYSVDGGAWQTIAQSVTAQAAATTLTVKEARSVLVANPGER